MTTGGCHAVLRDTFAVLQDVGKYEAFGVSMTWTHALEASCMDIEIQCQDDMCELAWDLCAATVVEHAGRKLSFTHGLPRRATLLLHEDNNVRRAFVDEVKNDWEKFEELQKSKMDWAQQLVERSPFQKTAVVQLVQCLKLDGWEITDRYK